MKNNQVVEDSRYQTCVSLPLLKRVLESRMYFRRAVIEYQNHLYLSEHVSCN